MNQCINDKLLNSAAGKHWKKIGVHPHHGINVPLFSLHSQKSCGIGEFPDLLPLIPWCLEVGIDTIQLLPLNDTGNDSSPYNALSAFALNPLHLGLSQLPNIEKYADLKEKISLLRRFNGTKRVQYREIISLRREILRQYAQREYVHFGDDENYQSYIEKNSWLEGYALFLVLKREYSWSSWETWPKEIAHPSKEMLQELLAKYREGVCREMFIQYLCFQQLKEVKDMAEKNGLFIKGDIPILISRDSADVWLNRSLFKMDFSAGAPPDMYNPNGQNWGFPVYDWEEIERCQYEWWLKRLSLASMFYHIYRIDHIVGFFRIWSIPRGKGNGGYFIPEDEALWIDHGKKIMLEMLRECSMLPIGEDLGVVPTNVKKCLEELGICGTRVMRWERKWEEDQSFIAPCDYMLESMTTVSTHDSEPLSLWWKNSTREAQDFAQSKRWQYESRISQDQLYEILRDSHCSRSLFHINLFQEYLTLIPGMTSDKLEDERVNVPGKNSEKNWSYRFIPSVEEIVSHQELKNVIRSLTLNT